MKTVSELKAEAKALEIKGYAKMKKSELLKAIRTVRNAPAIDVQTVDDVTDRFIHGIGAGMSLIKETGKRFSDTVRTICGIKDQSARMERLQHIYTRLESWINEPDGIDCNGEQRSGQSPEVSKVREVLIRVSRETLGQSNGVSFSLKDNQVSYKAARVNNNKRGGGARTTPKPTTNTAPSKTRTADAVAADVIAFVTAGLDDRAHAEERWNLVLDKVEAGLAKHYSK